jgi:hypothetical protein
MTLRWRRKPQQGRYYGPAAHELRDGQKVLVTAQQQRDDSWFIYGLGINTAGQPVATLDLAKAQGDAVAREKYRAGAP